jgi:hypothetical protein
VNLAEQHGKEGVITSAYREYAEEAQLSDVKYVPCERRHELTDGVKDTANMTFMRRPRV